MLRVESKIVSRKEKPLDLVGLATTASFLLKEEIVAIDSEKISLLELPPISELVWVRELTSIVSAKRNHII